MHRRHFLTGMAGAAAVPVLGGPDRHRKPTTYVVSDEPGVTPEGIAVARDGHLYVTSVSTGAVYRGHVRRPRMELFLPGGGDGRTAAAGIHTDAAGRIFVAGYNSGALFVYAPSGHLIARRTAETPGAALNDLVVTHDAVYVTDSATGTVHRASWGRGTLGTLRPWLTPDRFDPAPSFLNGIVSTGRHLLVSDQGTEVLHRVTPGRREVVPVRTSATMAGDGLLLEGHRLHAVVNHADGAGGVTFTVRTALLSPDAASGRVVAESGTATSAETPTTIARDGDRLLWVNSQIFSPAPAAPYTVTVVPRG
ncbi:superoxide dismutase [Polymorphospora sp. NPDC050346]|uniref:superoxide dismutase n=1 Tax=Polymorphospora sp. NPDC050346 TaxID=3155780 RepID=UPI0033C43F33